MGGLAINVLQPAYAAQMKQLEGEVITKWFATDCDVSGEYSINRVLSHGDNSCSSSGSSSETVTHGALPAGLLMLAALLGLGACTAAASGCATIPSASCSLHVWHR
jgi:hypothetical protein